MDLSEKSEGGESGKGSSSPRILLIGKDGPTEGSLEQALTALDCSFARAAGSASALRQLRETPFAVVITDPDTTIHEDLALVDEIRHIRPGVRVIILAPDGTPEELIEALRQRTFLCQVAPFKSRDIARYALSAIKADPADGIDVISANRNWISVRMNCSILNADRLTSFFHQFRMTVPDPPPEEVMIAFEEILNNAVEHGAQNDPSKLVEVAAVRTARAAVFYISDPGKGFRRDAIPHAAISYAPAYVTRHLEVREASGMRPGGYGMLLAKGIVDELIYSDVGNEVLLIKHMDVPDHDRDWTDQEHHSGLASSGPAC
jgi:anti-sigma regulatory factor (Ser/Thr protein kinase)/ActR/RegA family two-component response regulator